MPFRSKFTSIAPVAAPTPTGAGKDSAGKRIAIDLGLRLGISSTTAARWHREGAPFPADIDNATSDEYGALMDWVLSKNYKVPEALARLRAGDLRLAGAAPVAGEVVLEKGLRAEMKRLEDEAAMNYTLYKQFERGDPALRTSYHKTWTMSVQTLAKIAKEVPDHELSEEKVVPVEDIRRAIRTMLGEFRVAMDALPFRLSSLLRGISDPVTLQEIVEREKESVLRMLREYDWKTTAKPVTENLDEPTASGPAN